jgi:hypothetical protein
MSIFSGGLVVVPSQFLKNLKSIDRGLDCEYNRFSDKFLITQNGHIIYTISGRYPDGRELLIIRESDLRRKSLKIRLKESEERAKEVKIKAEKSARENIRDRTKDDKIQLQNVFARADVGGKHNSTFKRINVKPKGKVFE